MITVVVQYIAIELDTRNIEEINLYRNEYVERNFSGLKKIKSMPFLTSHNYARLIAESCLYLFL